MAAHHWIVHFPLALLVTGAGADLVGVATRDERLRRWATPLLVLGAAAALLAFFTGQGAMMMLQGGPASAEGVEAHTRWGATAVWPLALAGGLRLAWRRRLAGAHGWALLAAGLVSTILVVAIAGTGMAVGHG